jgi:hypothetical protein
MSCELVEDNYDSRQFIFQNYTENTYSDTKISAGEIVGNKIVIHNVENIGNILPKENNAFNETKKEKTEIWDRIFLDFIKNYDDVGCFLIEFSDSRKLFIEVGYYGDFGDELNAIKTLLKSTKINGIYVEDFVIIRENKRFANKELS